MIYKTFRNKKTGEIVVFKYDISTEKMTQHGSYKTITGAIKAIKRAKEKETMESLGLTRVKTESGKVYWE